MSIPPAPAPQDTPPTPDPSAPPEGTPDPPQINYEQRYNDLRPQFDRTSQEAAELRTWKERLTSDEAAQREFLQSLGYEVEEPDPGYQDPSTELAQRLERIEQQWTEQQAQQQSQAAQQRDVEHIGRGLLEAQKQLGRDLTEQEVQLLGDAAATNRDDSGLPNITAVTQLWMAAREHDQKTWAQTKKRAPAITPGGQPGSKVPDLSNENERLAWMAQRLDDLNAT